MAVPAWTVLFVAALALRSALAVGVIADSERSSRIQGDGLAVGETVRLKLTTHGGPDVRFLLCGRSNCGVTKIRGIAEDGRLSYRTYAGTNLHGNGGRRTADVDVGKGVPIPDGDYTFVVRRDSAREMSVWQEGRQGQRIVIPIDPEYANLHSKSLTDNVIRNTDNLDSTIQRILRSRSTDDHDCKLRTPLSVTKTHCILRINETPRGKYYP
ncbi:hypothetical protein ONE63_009566 [Megalurothrips usitatus]|uniref:Uncharacterized protein n=1 Tax=Megalurothrips usitatus TaxID=439358 RepID=A0AAV7XPS9_9NEOP|nr:hypothetical protein ONE63_009566 [Megalurothrips usitatus]